MHWMFLADWQCAYPAAETWIAPGLRRRRQVSRSGIRLDHDLSDVTPPDWKGVQVAVVQGGMGFREVALFHTPSRTMLLTDLVLDLPSSQVPPLLRPVAGKLGIVESDGKPPVYLRWVIRLQRHEAATVAERLLSMDPERVGSGGRRPALRHAVSWLLY